MYNYWYLKKLLGKVQCINMSIKENLKRGTVEMLVLYLLNTKDMYGYEISKELSKKSDGLYTLQEGTMYSTLYRLIEKGYISDRREYIGERQRRIRVYYHLEPSGLQYLNQTMQEYIALTKGIDSIING